jgi:vacuolar-type H+-ATPase subunit F/Vma7
MPPTLENISRAPLVIFGAEDVILGFKALGFHVYAVKDATELKAVLPAAVEGGAIVCLVEENLYQGVLPDISRYKNLPWPIFIPFSRDAKTDLLDKLVKEIRLKATGVV